MSVYGKHYRVEDEKLITGAGRFLDDIKLDNMAYLAVVRSPYAHAKIKSFDSADAQAAPGVIAVLTGEDYDTRGLGVFPCPLPRKRADGSDTPVPPRPALNSDVVKHVGDPVAFVVAETRAQALDAAELVEVDYEPLEAITDMEAAIAPQASAIWPDCEDNVAFVMSLGDRQATEKAMKDAAHIIKQRFPITRVSANPIEPRGAIGVFDKENDDYTLYAGLQAMPATRRDLSGGIFKIAPEKIRLIVPDTGGGFGMKGGVFPEYALVMWAAEIIGRPVKWLASRAESFLSDEHAREAIFEASLALDEDGKFLGLKSDSIAALGAYLSSRGPISPTENLGTMAGVYIIPAMCADIRAVYTNTQPVAPYRGAGRPEAAYVIERLIDKAARALEIDPAELRRKNTIPKNAFPYKTALTFTYDCGAFGDNLDKALKLADYDGFAARRKISETAGKLRGIGISNTIERAASPLPFPDKARLEMDDKGRLEITLGSVSQGQGHETTLLPMVVETLGVKPEDVVFQTGDTARGVYGGGTFGSRTATMAGSALKFANDDLISQGLGSAGEVLDVNPEEIEFSAGLFRVKDTNRSISLSEIAADSTFEDEITGETKKGLAAKGQFSAEVPNFPNGAHVCEVEIDPETGAVAIVNYAVVDDVGTVLNHELVDGQIHGGIAQGLGQILFEQIVFDPDSGQLLTGSFMDYAMPRADDTVFIKTEFNPVPTATNPLGTKGVGEAGTVGVFPALMNAIEHALAMRGVDHIDMPATPARIWQALQQAKS